jgi:hypothetical protein
MGANGRNECGGECGRMGCGDAGAQRFKVGGERAEENTRAEMDVRVEKGSTRALCVCVSGWKREAREGEGMRPGPHHLSRDG